MSDYGLPFLGEGDRNYQLWLEFQRRLTFMQQLGVTTPKKSTTGRAAINWVAASQAIVGINPGFGAIGVDKFLVVASHRQIAGDVGITGPISIQVENWTSSGFILRVLSGGSNTGTSHVDWYAREI